MSKTVPLCLFLSTIAGTALAQTPPPTPDQPAPPANGGMPGMPGTPNTPPVAETPTPPPEDPKAEKKHKPGDFDAGGQLRFPSGPDEMDKFAAFNFVALDAKGTYFLLPSVTFNGFFPLAVKHPDTIAGGMVEPKMVGGARFELDASIPKMPKLPGLPYETSIGLALGFGYMREGALLLTPQDYPLFVGDFQPGVTGGLLTNIKLSSLVDFKLNPVLIFQKGTAENLTAIQIPLGLSVKLGSVVKLGLDLAVNTGDNFKFSGDSGGRISVGGSLELKVGKIIVHTGAGLASLLTGGLYPSVSDSVFVDVNAKYAK